MTDEHTTMTPDYTEHTAPYPPAAPVFCTKKDGKVTVEMPEEVALQLVALISATNGNRRKHFLHDVAATMRSCLLGPVDNYDRAILRHTDRPLIGSFVIDLSNPKIVFHRCTPES